MSWLLSLALAAPLHTAIPLENFYNHDMFVEDPSRKQLYYKMQSWLPSALPAGMAPDLRADPDVVLLPQQGVVNIPVQAAGRTLYLLTAGYGDLSARDIAADAVLYYSGGQRQQVKWLVGEQAWPAWAGATGRSADPVPLGVNAGGDLLTASLLTVPLSWPGVAVERIELRGRPGNLRLALLAAAVSTEAPIPVQEIPAAGPEGYAFAIPVDTPLPMPEGARVRGPVTAPIRAAGGRLTERLWGVNLVGEGALPPPELAEAEAQAIAGAGFNLVRLHHIDDDGFLPAPDRGEPGRPLADPAWLDRLDRFVAELGKAGVYVLLEGLTRRSFRPAEGVRFPDGVPVGNKLVVQFRPEWLAAEERWLRALYDRVNPYTGRRYADDPAVALIELSNENSLLVAWHTGSIERLPPMHRRELDDLWNAWLLQKYGKDAALAAAWSAKSRGGLLPGESLDLASVSREPLLRSRSELFPAQRAADLVTFYSGLERAHQRRILALFRDMGFTAPSICNTSFGLPPADALLSDCDVTDLHIYWDPPAESLAFQNTSLIRAPGRLLERLAWCQDGKPCTISELNHGFPNRYAQEAPLLWAALAQRQQIDAVIWFAWSHSRYDRAPDGPGGALDLAGRFNVWAQLPAAAALYRAADPAPPARRHVRWWSPDGLLRDLSEPAGLWLDPQVSPASLLDTVLRTSFAPAPPPLPRVPVAEVPNPFSWETDPGIFRVETPQVHALLGATMNQETSMLKSQVTQNIALSLTALQGDLSDPAEALLTIVGRCWRDGTVWSRGPGALALGQGPALLERLTGSVAFRWPRRPEVWTIRADGTQGEQVRVRGRGGWWTVEAGGESPWMRIR